MGEVRGDEAAGLYDGGESVVSIRRRSMRPAWSSLSANASTSFTQPRSWARMRWYESSSVEPWLIV